VLRDPASNSNDRDTRTPRNWTRLWAVAGAIFLIVLAVRLPAHLEAGDSGQLMRDAGLALLCINMIVQAVATRWPVIFSMGISLIGVALWLAGVLL
jgi:hypothetical protein